MMQMNLDLTNDDKKFYQAIGLLVSREITAEMAAQMSGYTFNSFLEILKKKKIFPYIYNNKNYQMDLQYIQNQEWILNINGFFF